MICSRQKAPELILSYFPHPPNPHPKKWGLFFSPWQEILTIQGSLLN
jgi:hypothetical protein